MTLPESRGHRTADEGTSTLAERLRSMMVGHERRTNERLSATSLSQRIRARGGSVSHATVAAILNGSNRNPSLNTLRELAGFLGCEVADLTGGQRTAADNALPLRPSAKHRTLPEKLTYALRVRRDIKPDEQHTPEEIATILVREHGVRAVTGPDIRQLCCDPAANPTKDVLEGLARYLGVPAGYLLDDDRVADRVEHQLEQLAEYSRLSRTARDAGVRGWAARLGALPPDKLAAVIAVVEALDDDTTRPR